MASEYDPIRFLRRSPPEDDPDFEPVRRRFQAAGRPYLSSPWPWCTWALLMPAAALLTPAAARDGGPPAVLILWGVTIVTGGVVEAWAFRRAGAGGSALARWALRVQGNLSLIALAMSVLLIVVGQERALPGLWLLMLGHSFYSLGGLSFAALRRHGLLYQLGGVAALILLDQALLVFGGTTFVANAALALAVWRQPRD